MKFPFPHRASHPRRSLYRFVFKDVVIAQCVSLFATLVWGILLLLPGHLFATNAVFGQMALHGREWQFGLLLLLLAITQGLALRVCRLPVEFMALAGGALTWGTLSLLVANGSAAFPWAWLHWLPYAPGPYIYGGLCIWLCACLLRIGPGLGDDMVLWQRSHEMRRSARTLARAQAVAQTTSKLVDERQRDERQTRSEETQMNARQTNAGQSDPCVSFSDPCVPFSGPPRLAAEPRSAIGRASAHDH